MAKFEKLEILNVLVPELLPNSKQYLSGDIVDFVLRIWPKQCNESFWSLRFA